MSIFNSTRRQFLKGACFVTGGLFLGLRGASSAFAAVKNLKDFMEDRVATVYATDDAFAKRASQDNEQVRKMYDTWLGKPLGHKSEELLHTKWFDKSQFVKDLIAHGNGAYPNPRHKDFAGDLYPYEYED